MQISQFDPRAVAVWRTSVLAAGRQLSAFAVARIAVSVVAQLRIKQDKLIKWVGPGVLPRLKGHPVRNPSEDAARAAPLALQACATATAVWQLVNLHQGTSFHRL
jgi:hypothetical protein